MAATDFQLSDIERACGVTMQDVMTTCMRGLVFDDGDAFTPGSGTSPAVGGAVARYALGGPVEYRGHNALGQPIYRRT